MKQFCYAAACLLAGVFAHHGVAAEDLVTDYFAGLNSFQAEFAQTVRDDRGELVQQARGSVWIQRPGRFRWDYEAPYQQLIVADGERLWTYDADLEQATVERVDEALSSTPAMLLSGFRPLEEVMDWTRAASSDGLTWYRLEPKQKDAAVEEVRIGFQNEQLAVIEVRDGFGNHTRIQFSDIRRNQTVNAARFRIELPEGTDIIGETP